MRPDSLIESRVAAPDGLQDGDRRRVIGQCVPAPEFQCRGDCQQVVSGAAACENARRLAKRAYCEPAHCEMKTTPIRIRPTPVQRRQSTASFNNIRASRVSGMNAAADIGTANVIGAIDTSFMNEKKETAMAQVEMITYELRATIPNARPIASGRKS